MMTRTFSPPPGLSPRLTEHIHLLARALDKDNAAQAVAELVLCFRELLCLYAGCTAGQVKRLETSRPEVGALADNMTSIVQYERLLRFALSVLRTLRHPIKDYLLGVFYLPEGEDRMAWTPLLHSHWLQLSLSSNPDLPSLSDLSHEVEQLGGLDSSRAAELLQGYLPVFESWLAASVPFLESFQPVIEEVDGQQTLVGYERVDFRFDLLPPLKWSDPPPEPVKTITAVKRPTAVFVPPPITEPEPGQIPPAEALPPSFPDWSPAQLEAVAVALDRQLLPLEARVAPLTSMEEVWRWSRQRPSGYLLLQGPQGSCKTLLVSSLATYAESDLKIVTLALDSSLQPEWETFTEVLDEHLAWYCQVHPNGPRALGPKVTQDLNRRFPGTERAERFRAYLNELVVLNDCRLMLVFDGPDEGMSRSELGSCFWDFLPDRLPENCYVVVTIPLGGGASGEPSTLSSAARERLRRLHRADAAVLLKLDPQSEALQTLTAATLQQLARKPHDAQELHRMSQGRLAYAVHLMEARQAGLLTDAAPDQLYARLLQALERRLGVPLLRFLLLLASSYDPLETEELASLGIDPDVILEIAESVPSLLYFDRLGRIRGIRLASEELREFLQEQYSYQWAETCAWLAEHAFRELNEAAESEGEYSLDELHVRFDRLYRWLPDTLKAELVLRVVRSPVMRRLRERVCAQLEAQGRLHHKLSIQGRYQRSLESALEFESSPELREELAWAHNSRGLTFRKMGQYLLCLEELQAAKAHLEILVDLEGHQEYLSGLAAAHNRMSEAYWHLGQWMPALECARQALNTYTIVVQGQERKNLKHLLALAQVQLGRSLASQGQYDAALAELTPAMEIFRSLSQTEPGATGATHQNTIELSYAEALLERARAFRELGRPTEAGHDFGRCLRVLRSLQVWSPSEDLEELLANTLAEHAEWQAANDEMALAAEAFSQSIGLLGPMIGRGRIDLRKPMAELRLRRGAIQLELGLAAAARDDFGEALALYQHLIEREGRVELYPKRARCHLQLAMAEGNGLSHFEQAIADYKRADALDGEQSLELARAHQAAGSILWQRGELASAQLHYVEAGRLFQVGSGSPAELASSLLECADAKTRLNLLAEAREDLDQALSILQASHDEDGAGPDHGALATDALLRRGRLLCQLGESAAAIDDLSECVELLKQSEDDSPALAHKLYEALMARSEASGLLDDVAASLADLDRAARWLRQASTRTLVGEQTPGFEIELSRLYQKQSQIHASGKAFPQALKALESALEPLLADDVEHTYERAKILLERSDIQRELQAYKAAVTDVVAASNLEIGDSDLVSQYRQRVLSLERDLQLRCSQRIAAGELEQAGSLAELQLWLARHLVEAGWSADSVHVAQALNQRGYLRMLNGQLAGAFEDYNASIALGDKRLAADPGDSHVPYPARSLQAWAYRHRSLAHELAGQRAEALFDLDAGLVLYQQEPLPLVASELIQLFTHRARLRLGEADRALEPIRQDYARAVALIRRQLTLEEPGPWGAMLASTLVALADLTLEVGRSQEALPLYREADALLRADGQESAASLHCAVQESFILASLGKPLGDLLTRTLVSAIRTVRQGGDVPLLDVCRLIETATRVASDDGALPLCYGFGLALAESDRQPAHWGPLPDLFLKLGLGRTGRQSQAWLLAALLSQRELQNPGAASVGRVTHCLRGLGAALSKEEGWPAGLEHVHRVVTALEAALVGLQLPSEVAVEVNNTALQWQAASAELLEGAGLTRAQLNGLRLW